MTCKKLQKVGACLLTVLTLLTLSSCGEQKQRFSETYLEYFDTGSTIIGYEHNSSDFEKTCDLIEGQLREYHKLYDIYHAYEGVNNLYTVNQNAGIQPVTVDSRILDLLEYAKQMYELTDGTVNVAMGSVLKVWHGYREAGLADPQRATLPTDEELTLAAAHTDIGKIVIDHEKSTVFLSDNKMSLDVGAVAKGYAAEQIANQLIEKGITGYTLNVGGNIRTIGNKGDGQAWTAGIVNPDVDSDLPFILRVSLSDQVLVTSGSYERYYEVDGKQYHHIIDPVTLFPKNTFVSVSVSAKDSGLADALSTALFNLPLEDGKRLIESLDGTEALWITPDGKLTCTDGFEKIIIERLDRNGDL